MMCVCGLKVHRNANQPQAAFLQGHVHTSMVMSCIGLTVTFLVIKCSVPSSVSQTYVL